jgi:hypothetical protein
MIGLDLPPSKWAQDFRPSCREPLWLEVIAALGRRYFAGAAALCRAPRVRIDQRAITVEMLAFSIPGAFLTDDTSTLLVEAAHEAGATSVVVALLDWEGEVLRLWGGNASEAVQ